MQPVRLELKNFLAYQEPAPVLFDGLHLACLTGPNGAGKSALLDAMTWALWGKARANENHQLIHIGQEDMHVIFDFRHDGALYRVTRAYTRRRRNQASTLDLAIWDPQQQCFASISEPTIRDTEQKINDLLRLDYDTFVNSAFVRQGHADSFTASTPAQRKALLAEILGLARWQKLEEQAKAQLLDVENELQDLQRDIKRYEDAEAREPEQRRALAEAEQVTEQAQKAREEAEARYAAVAEISAQLQAARRQRDDAQRRLTEIQQEMADLERERADAEGRLRDYEKLIAHREQIEAGEGQLQAARARQEALDDLAAQYSDLERGLAALNAQLERESARLEQEAASLEKAIRDSEREAAQIEALDAELKRTRAELDGLDAQRARRERLQEAQRNLESEAISLGERNKSLDAEIKELRQRLKMLQSAQEARCPVCNGPLNEDQRADLSEKVTAQGVERRQSLEANQARLKEIDAEKARLAAELSSIDKMLRDEGRLKSIEGRALATLDKAHAALRKLEQDDAALAVLRQQIEAKDFAADVRREIALRGEHIAALDYDRDEHKAVRDAVRRLRSFDEQARQLHVALQSFHDVQGALENIAARAGRYAEQRAAEEVRLAELDRLMVELTAHAKEAERIQAEVRRLRDVERRTHERLIKVQQELKAIEDGRRHKEELMVRRERASEDKTLYTRLRDAFGKNGVPAMIIEAAIPELEAQTNELLARMTDGRMHVRLDTQRAKRSGDGMIETLDILISDELGTRDYDLFSGGEGFRINFALRIALSQFLARRAGARLQTLVIDEGFGSQDSAGRERLVEAINAIRDDFDLVLVVTHIDELRDAFPARIEIEKGDKGSMVTVR
ncbi:MAG: SMC family ATPase [Anaerolineae bacterium]|nr:SMC family ATPase [Anaerolineae bacterium]